MILSNLMAIEDIHSVLKVLMTNFKQMLLSFPIDMLEEAYQSSLSLFLIYSFAICIMGVITCHKSYTANKL